MQLTAKKTSALLALMMALIATMALAYSPPAKAGEFCTNQQVNNVQKCWGVPRLMSVAYATGVSTGVCVGEDLVQGQCSPVGQLAVVETSYGEHLPWVIGTASALTTASAWTY